MPFLEADLRTIALNEVAPGHDELKTMRTSPAHRGQGIAAQLLEWALDDARSGGVQRVSLETGAAPFFAAAHALYKKAGFVECKPFGKYRKDPNSVFMTGEIWGAPVSLLPDDGVLARVLGGRET